MSRFLPFLSLTLCFWFGLLSSSLAKDSGTIPTDLNEPGRTIYELILGNLALTAGDNQLAYSLLKPAAEKLHSSSVAELAWTAAVKTRSNQQILEASHLWSKMDPSAGVANDALLMDAILHQNDAQVRKLLDQLSKQHQKDEASYIAKITRLLASDNIDHLWFEGFLEPFWDKYPKDIQLNIAKALYKRRLGEDKEACRSALSIVPGNGIVFRERDLPWFVENEEAVTTAADVCWSTMPEKSQRLLETVLTANPASTVGHLMYGKTLARYGRFEQAIQEAQEAVKLDPHNPTILFNAGSLAAESQNYTLAKEWFHQYIVTGRAQNPSHDWATDDVWLALASVYDHLGDFVSEAEALSRYSPKHNLPEIRIQETVAWLKAGRPDTAESVLLTAIEKDPNNERTYFNARIEILLKSGQSAKAIQILKNILEHDPNNEDILFNLALIYEHLKEPSKAEEIFKQILRINPHNAFAANGLGYYYVQRGEKLHLARTLLETAYRQSPLDWHVLDSMAWLSFKEKRFEQAYYFALAAMKGAFHQEVVMHMIEILVSLNQMHDAQAVFNELIHRNPKAIDVLELGKKLKLQLPPDHQ